MSDYDDDFDDALLAGIDLAVIETKFMPNNDPPEPMIVEKQQDSSIFANIQIASRIQNIPKSTDNTKSIQGSHPKKFKQPTFQFNSDSVPVTQTSRPPPAKQTSNNIKTEDLEKKEFKEPKMTEITELQSTIKVQLTGDFLKHNHRLNDATKETWVYPTNYTTRAYQLNISKTCLVRNTLVSLPTGLGKTFIAAVVMYNFYRWFPAGKIVFLAPTKPLVAQQIEACYRITGISEVIQF